MKILFIFLVMIGCVFHGSLHLQMHIFVSSMSPTHACAITIIFMIKNNFFRIYYHHRWGSGGIILPAVSADEFARLQNGRTWPRFCLLEVAVLKVSRSEVWWLRKSWEAINNFHQLFIYIMLRMNWLYVLCTVTGICNSQLAQQWVLTMVTVICTLLVFEAWVLRFNRPLKPVKLCFWDCTTW